MDYELTPEGELREIQPPGELEVVGPSDFAVASADPGLNEMLAELDVGKVAPKLQENANRLDRRVKDAEELNAADWAESIRKRPEFLQMQGGIPALYEVWQRYERDRAEIQNDPGLNAHGRLNRLTVREAQHAETEAALEHEYITGPGADLVTKLTPGYPAPTSTQMAEIQMLYARFPHLLAQDFFSEAASALDQALRTTGPDRVRWGQLVKAYAPLVQRRATSPEPHARQLTAAHATLAQAMRRFVHYMQGGIGQRVARELVEAERDRFRTAAGMAHMAGRWDRETSELIGMAIR